jgi:hypothetical protein
MMMSCRKATHLMSQELDRKLSTRERMALRFHVLMCSGCTNFRRNMSFLRRTCSRVVEDAREDRPDNGQQ